MLLGRFFFLFLPAEVVLGVKYSVIVKSHKLLLDVVELEYTVLLSVSCSYGDGSVF